MRGFNVSISLHRNRVGVDHGMYLKFGLTCDYFIEEGKKIIYTFDIRIKSSSNKMRGEVSSLQKYFK